MKQTNEKTMTNNKQHTAVEWLAEQMEILHYDYWAEHISKDEKNQRLKQLKEQAKEMEKERIETAYNKGTVHGIDYPESTLPITGEQYYNETFGGNNEQH
jgi:alpha-amylase/alpha-mannosidase (GH57 family)